MQKYNLDSKQMLDIDIKDGKYPELKSQIDDLNQIYKN